MSQLLVIVTRLGRIVLPAVALASCGTGYEELPSYRYRLTIEVETPEGLKRGSSVIEVRTWLAGPNTVPTPNVIRTRENGEAVTIDLGRRGKVFALMRAGNLMDWPGRVAVTLSAPERGDPRISRRAEIVEAKALKGIHEVSRTRLSGGSIWQNWPDFVIFKNPSLPKTIKWIDPGRFEQAFGEGVAVRRVTVEIVQQSVTRRISQELPWLADPAATQTLPLDIDRGSEDLFIPPLSKIDFTRSVDR